MPIRATGRSSSSRTSSSTPLRSSKRLKVRPRRPSISYSNGLGFTGTVPWRPGPPSTLKTWSNANSRDATNTWLAIGGSIGARQQREVSSSELHAHSHLDQPAALDVAHALIGRSELRDAAEDGGVVRQVVQVDPRLERFVAGLPRLAHADVER